MLKLLPLLLLLVCQAQTRISLAQLQGIGTSPKASWNRAMWGQQLNPRQVQLPTVSQLTTGPRSFEIVADGQKCSVALLGDSALVLVVYSNGRLSILSGYRNGKRYVTTSETVTLAGSCQAIDTVDGAYPRSINAFLYFGVYGMPTSRALKLRMVPTPFLPYSYAMGENGLTSVEGAGGRIIWEGEK